MAEVKGHVSFCVSCGEAIFFKRMVFLLFLGNVQSVAEGGEEKNDTLIGKGESKQPVGA